jgi:hypothetical protein
MDAKAKIRVLGEEIGSHDGSEARETREARDGPVDDRPRSVYEIVTRQMLAELKEDVNEVKGRVNTLLWLVAGAVVLELVVRLVK